MAKKKKEIPSPKPPTYTSNEQFITQEDIQKVLVAPKHYNLTYNMSQILTAMQQTSYTFGSVSATTMDLSQSLSNIMYGGASMGTGSGSSMTRRHSDKFSKKYKHPTMSGDLPLSSIIMDLNDNVGWTREQIADWLDTLDDQPVFYPDTCPPDCECKLCKPITDVPVIVGQEASNGISISYEKDYDLEPISVGSSTFQLPTQTSYTGNISFTTELIDKLDSSQLDFFKKELDKSNSGYNPDTAIYTLQYNGDPYWVAEKINTVKGLLYNVQPQPNLCPHCLHPAGHDTLHYSGCPSTKPFDW
jgi:hypothetical protein